VAREPVETRAVEQRPDPPLAHRLAPRAGRGRHADAQHVGVGHLARAEAPRVQEVQHVLQPLEASRPDRVQHVELAREAHAEVRGIEDVPGAQARPRGEEVRLELRHRERVAEREHADVFRGVREPLVHRHEHRERVAVERAEQQRRERRGRPQEQLRAEAQGERGDREMAIHQRAAPAGVRTGSR
jgi:hypothetical protein